MGRWAADGTNVDYQVDVSEIKTTNLVPTETQDKNTPTPFTQTQNGTLIPPSSWGTSQWFPCAGFDFLCVHLTNNSSKETSIYIDWSNDGSVQIGTEAELKRSAVQFKSLEVTVKANYYRISPYNYDAGAQSISSHTYLRKG